ncbi:hypothetical protein R6Q59_016464 [Mikania micrantha]
MTSSSSVEKSFKYDVFLSFRGEDTRKTFVDHLHLALVNKGIITYKDDETIEKGERIDDQLITPIEESRFHIIVFSKNYANSSWCLQELSKIMECQKTKEQTAYPVFYDVEPTEVRNQSGAVGEAFAKHVENPAAGKWRDDLIEASNLAGWELKNTVDGHEAKFIQKIVTKISLKLHLINWSIDENLVGMETRVMNVISSLETDPQDDVRMIGIWGMGGAGKTTLARAVFDRNSIFFEGKSFVENVRDCSKGKGLKGLQKQVLKNVLNDQSIDVTSVFDGINKMKKMMPGRKVLVVLDDVDDIDQLEALAGSPNWFKPGSRIIITTRDRQVLIAQGVHVDNIYNISLLSDDEAICLFSRRAFRREVPIQGYEKLSQQVVYYAKGLPLTIKVLGSFLYGITDRPKWVDTLERLKTIPLEKTLKILEISYDGLEKDHKEIFLDVACMLKGELKDKAIRILEGCGFHAQIGLEVLEQRSLINISNYGILSMHDHLDEMGRNIVRRLHPDEPNRHSRLWVKEEIEEILVNNLGTKDTRSMIMEDMDVHPAIVMQSLRKMKNLRLLFVTNDVLSKNWEIVEGGVQYLPDTLRSLHWSRYPLCCLPKTFQANNLVNLEMPYSYISQLWEGGERKVLEKLRFVDLMFSKLRTFDLGMTRNLKRLNLSYCEGLVELQMPVALPILDCLNLRHSKVSNLNLGMTPNIKKLDLSGCKDLVELQMPVALPILNDLRLSHSKVTNLNLGMTPNIKNLCLEGCKDLVELQMPVALPMLHNLNFCDSKVSNLNLGMIPNIKELRLQGCDDLVELQMPVALPMLNYLDLSDSKVSNLNLGMTPNIVNLCLEGCGVLVELKIPDALRKLKYLNLSYSKVSNLNLGMTPNIKELCLKGCDDLVELQMPVALPMHEYLNLSYSKVSNLNLEMTPNIKELCLQGCNDLVELQMPVALPMLDYLDLSDSKVSNLNLGMTPNIVTLCLEGCEDLVELQMPVALPMLNYLNLSHSKVSNLNLGMTPNIKNLCLEECQDLVELQLAVALPMLNNLNLSHSKMSNLNLGMTPNIKKLHLEGCKDLVELQMPVALPMLDYLNLSHSKVSNLNLGMTPNIEELSLTRCDDLVELQIPVALPMLEYLNLSHSKVSNLNLGMTPNLESFSASICGLPSSSGDLERLISFGLCGCTNSEYFSASICGLKHLTALALDGNIPEAPKYLWKLKSLEKLTLSMKEIKHLPDNICTLKRLKSLDLKSCWLLEQLPMDLGGLECLEELHLTDCVSLRDIPDSICKIICLKLLNIEGAGISRLPESIFQLKDLRISMEFW